MIIVIITSHCLVFFILPISLHRRFIDTHRMIDVSSAMRYMEEMQMVHCSLSASCVLVYEERAEMRGKICSFGSCRGAGLLSKSEVQELAVRWTVSRCISCIKEKSTETWTVARDDDRRKMYKQGEKRDIIAYRADVMTSE